MDNQAFKDEINLYDYLKIIYKWKFLIIMCWLDNQRAVVYG